MNKNNKNIMTYAKFCQLFVEMNGTNFLGPGISTFLGHECMQHIHSIGQFNQFKRAGVIGPAWMAIPCSRHSLPYMPDLIFTNFSDCITVQHKFRYLSPATKSLILNWDKNNSVDILSLGLNSNDIFLNQLHTDSRFKLWLQNYDYIHNDLDQQSLDLFKAFLDYKEYCTQVQYRDVNTMIAQCQTSNEVSTMFGGNLDSLEKKEVIDHLTSNNNFDISKE